MASREELILEEINKRIHEEHEKQKANEKIDAHVEAWKEISGLPEAKVDEIAREVRENFEFVDDVEIERVEADLRREGDTDSPHAGFRIRFVARIIDLLLLQFVIEVCGPSEEVVWLLYAGGSVFFHGTFGGTPGKLIFGLRLVTRDYGKVSYLRCFGRLFAEIPSLVFFIGYLRVLWDCERRTFHDQICRTFVVHKSVLLGRRLG